MLLATCWHSFFVRQSRCLTRYAQCLLMLLWLLCRHTPRGSTWTIPTLFLFLFWLLVMSWWKWVVKLEWVSTLEGLLISMRRWMRYSGYVRDSRCWFLMYCSSIGCFMIDRCCDRWSSRIKFVVVYIWDGWFMSYLLWLVDSRWHLILERIPIFGEVSTFVYRNEWLNVYVLFL